MRSLNRIGRKFYIKLLGSTINRSALSRLNGEQDSVCRLLGKVIEQVIQNQSSAEEKIWIEKIEKERKQLNQSTTKICFQDYGAGSAKSPLTAEQMVQGRRIEKTIGEVCQIASKSDQWTFLLFKLIRALRPSVSLELGTAMGISAAYLAAACELNELGKVVTLEGSESLASLARENFKKLGLNRVHLVQGRFQDVLDKVLLEQAPIDFAFIDGHHDEQATQKYFKQIVPYLSDHAVLIFDDIYWSNGMTRAWKRISQDENLKLTIDLGSVGLCLYSKEKQKRKNHYKIAI